MPRKPTITYRVTETCTYEVTACNSRQADALVRDSLRLPRGKRVTMTGVTERSVERLTPPKPRGRMVEVTFHPQAWVNDYATDADPEGPTTFQVPARDAWGLESDTDESDQLRQHPNAPAWIRKWSGPFWVEVPESEGVSNDK